MPFRDHHHGRTVVGVGLDLHHFRWAEGVGDEGLEVLVPANDVNLLALKLVNDTLDAVAAHADAGAHGIDALLARSHGYLAAEARLAGDFLDFHHPVVDLRHFHFEQPLQQVLVGARNDDFGAPWGPAHVEDVDLQPLAFTVPLGGHLLFQGQNGFHPAQLHDPDAPWLHLVQYAGYYVLCASQEFLEGFLPLRLAQALQYNLFGGLGGDTTGLVRQLFRGGDFLA